MIWILIAIGGAAGACLRALAGRLIVCDFPWATLAVNCLGSFILAALMAGRIPAHMEALLATGFCGAFTTFSTFILETLILWRSRQRRAALLNGGLTLLLCSLASLLGFYLFN
jgi:CrcB protein